MNDYESIMMLSSLEGGEGMIYTVTLSASLDYIGSVHNFELGVTNRTTSEMILPGGKGINVSMILQSLGIENKALGFIAGFVGEEIRKRVIEMGCQQDFIILPSGVSRINIKLKSIEGTEINGQGPYISSEYIEKLFKQLDSLNEHDILVLAGSVPDSVPDSIYKVIMNRLSDKKVMIVVDASNDLLVNVLENHPFLIKPNSFELGEIFGKDIHDRKDIMKHAKLLQQMGARNVLVSMAGDGAILAAENGRIYDAPAPKGKLKNGVGAGDSMVAGFLAGWLEAGDYEKAFRMGVASGSASAFSEHLATKEEIYKVLEQFDEKQ